MYGKLLHCRHLFSSLYKYLYHWQLENSTSSWSLAIIIIFDVKYWSQSLDCKSLYPEEAYGLDQLIDAVFYLNETPIIIMNRRSKSIKRIFCEYLPETCLS